MKKILIISMPFSVHTQRWLSAISELPLEIHFFSSFEYAKPMFDSPQVIYHDYLDNQKGNFHKGYYPIDTKWSWLKSIPTLSKLIGKIKRKAGLKKEYAWYLSKCIEKTKPEIVHTLETQHSAYLLLESISKQNLKKNFEWIHSTWGIDLHYFGHLADHKIKVKNVFELVDKYCAEGKRDILLAKKHGFKNEEYIFPSVGGYYEIDPFPDLPSTRKTILLKGYENELRRGLNGLKALEKVADILGQYKIIIYSASPILEETVKKSCLQSQIDIVSDLSHQKMIELTKTAIISMTINLSDGLPNSFIEAMGCGAFPIQSNTSMANEWIENGVTGFLVDSENITEISQAIQFAIANKQVIDKASIVNRKKFEESFNSEIIMAKMKDLYFTDSY